MNDPYKEGYYSYPAWGENPYRKGSVNHWLWDVGHHTAWCNL